MVCLLMFAVETPANAQDKGDSRAVGQELLRQENWSAPSRFRIDGRRMSPRERRLRMAARPTTASANGPVIGPLLASSPVQQSWVRNYPSTTIGATSYLASGVAIDGQGNIYVVGRGGTGPNYDFVTIKYTSSGDTVWARRYAGLSLDRDMLPILTVDASGNAYVAGMSTSSFDYTTIKYTSAGDTVWVRRYNGPGGSYDQPMDLTVDGSGNVYVTGFSRSSGGDDDYATIKYNAAGDTLWVRRYDSSQGNDNATAIAVDVSGNVYVTGSGAFSTNKFEYTTIKYSSVGDTVWVRRYRGSEVDDVFANALAVDSSGNVYVTGGSISSGSNYDYATIKYNSAGDTVWVRRYDASADYDEAVALAVGASGAVYVTGYSYSSSFDYATIKYTSSGDTAWVRRYNSPGNTNDFSTGLKLDRANNVYVTGVGNADFATIRYSSAGAEEWVQRYAGPGGSADEALALAVDTLGHVFVTGGSSSGGGSIFTTINYAQLFTYAASTVFLEGPYNTSTGKMNKTLSTSGTLTSHFAGVTIPSDAVDSITIEIRSSTSASSATRALTPAWLLTDGTVRSFSDTTKSYLGFDAPAGNYYVVIRHRNHLAVMSATAQSVASTPPGSAYDFSTALSQAYLNGQKAIGIKFGMFTGDANSDGQVTGSDFNVFDTAFRSAQTGYRISDWNLDAQVTGSDFNLFDTNFRAAASSKVP